MDHIQWIFSGIGTTILSSLISLVIGGFAGYRIGISRNKQKQKAGRNAVQVQKNSCHQEDSRNKQEQIAGDDSFQKQETQHD